MAAHGEGSCFRTLSAATAVECVLGPVNFTSRREELVVIRGTRLDIYACPGDLEHVAGGCINESVICLLAAGSGSCDLLVLVTVSLQILVVRYDNDAKVLQLLASADAGNMVLGATARPAACSVSSCRRFLAVYLYSNIVAIADLAGLEQCFEENGPIDLKDCKKMFYVDVKEQVVSLDFLPSDPTEPPKLIALHGREDACGAWEVGRKVLCVHAVDLQKKRAQCMAKPDLPSARGDANVPGRHYLSCDLIAVVPPSAGAWAAQGAVLAVGGDHVRLFNAELQALTTVKGTKACTSLVKANAAGSQWLAAGQLGDLYLLRFEADSGAVRLIVQCIGVSVPASGLATWQNGAYALVASQVSDSEVLRLREPGADAPATATTAAGRRRKNLEDAFEVIDTWTNLGPITDFCIKDLGSGAEVITCSGAGSNGLGSLRFIQMGIPLEELGAAGGLSGVLGMWTLGSLFLVLSRPGRTEVLRICEGETTTLLEPLGSDAVGSLRAEETLLCCCLADDTFAQVTAKRVVAVDQQLQPLSEWQMAPEFGATITAASEDGASGVLVASAWGDVFALELQREGAGGAGCRFIPRANWKVTGEPSCLASVHDGLDSHACAGLWGDELCVWQKELKEPLDRELQRLPLPTLPRSVAFLSIGGQLRLFAGLCDGRVVVVGRMLDGWQVQRTVTLGVQPVKLMLLPKMDAVFGPQLHQNSASEEMMLAISGHGSILQAQGQRVARIPICLPSMSHAAFFSHGLAGIDHCMAFISNERLLLGRLRCGERMHVRTLPLPQAPRRIAYHPATRICVAGCCDLSPAGGVPSARARAQLQFVHTDSVSILDTITLGHDEMLASVVTVSFTGDPTVYIAVGTAVVLQSEPEPTRGQVRLFAPCESSSSSEVALPPFRMVSCLDVQGAVYALNAFQGRLLGAVNNRLQLWDKGPSGQLVEVCRYSAGVIVLDIQTLGDLILVGDIMRSVTLIRFHPEERSFQTVAHDETSAWSTSVDMLSDNHFLCADDAGNLLSLRTAARSEKADGMQILERVGRIHTGEFMNRLRRSTSLHIASAGSRSTIWASSSGAFGLVLPVAGDRFARLLKLQEFIGHELRPMLSHKWHHARLDLQGDRLERSEAFLDGDLLGRFLTMPEEKQQALALRLAAGFTSDPMEELLQDLEVVSLP